MGDDLSQARYERALLMELSKLQAAIAEERTSIAAHKAYTEQTQAAERERKLSASDKASKLQAMEKAIQSAQQVEQRAFLKKRAEADKRFQAKEALAAKQRMIEARKAEEHRRMAQKLHEETLARAAEERAQAEQSKRMEDERKEAKLKARFAAERAALQERNIKKAEEAAEKVQRAAEQRVAITATQREQYEQRTAAQAERKEQLQQQQERRIVELRSAAKAKQAFIERAQEQQQALEEGRRQNILTQEAEKQQRLDLKAAREAEARRLLSHEKVLQEAAARGRVERTLGDLQSQLSDLEGQVDARQAKVEAFTSTRAASIEEGQRLSVQSALDRSQLANSMGKMRSNLSNNASLFLDVPPERRNIQNRELKALLNRIDPDGAGHIPLSSMRKTLTKLLPPEPEAKKHAARPAASKSLPSLLTQEQRNMSQYEQYMAAFKAVDSDGSGTISKRELYAVLKTAGLANGKQALEVFSGFDEDGDGNLDFDEFAKIASILC